MALVSLSKLAPEYSAQIPSGSASPSLSQGLKHPGTPRTVCEAELLSDWAGGFNELPVPCQEPCGSMGTGDWQAVLSTKA